MNTTPPNEEPLGGRDNLLGHICCTFYGYRFPLPIEVVDRFDLVSDLTLDKERVNILGFGGSSFLVCTDSVNRLSEVHLEEEEIKQGFVLKSEVYRVCEDSSNDEKQNFFAVSEEDKTSLNAAVAAMNLDPGPGGGANALEPNIGFFFIQRSLFGEEGGDHAWSQLNHVLRLAD